MLHIKERRMIYTTSKHDLEQGVQTSQSRPTGWTSNAWQSIANDILNGN